MYANELSQSKIKQIIGLQQKKCRDQEGLFVVEGEKMVLELIEESSTTIEYIVVLKGTELNCHTSLIIFECNEKILKKCSSLKTPNKMLAVCKKMSQQSAKSNLIIALDCIQDPGNLGTIMRIADWFGINQLICSHQTVDCYNSKVVQASMGAIFRVQVDYVNLKDYLSKTKLPIYVATLKGTSIYKQKFKKEGILLMGNEGNGVSEELLELAKERITIPQFGKAESLNVSVATGILVSEFCRNN